MYLSPNYISANKLNLHCNEKINEITIEFYQDI
jgi:hypothetical protein